MYLYQEARSVLSTFHYSNLARIAQVGINLPQNCTWTLRNYYTICRPQCNGRGTSESCVFRRSCLTFEENFVKSTRSNVKFSLVSGQITRACKSTLCLKPASAQTLEFTLFCLARMNSRKTPNIPRASECFFYRGIELCTIRTSTDMILSRALSTGSKQKPASEDKKNPQGATEKPETVDKQSKAKQLKKIFKEYGAVGVSFHIGISLISLGIFYVGLSSGINMAAVLCKLGFSESVVQSKMAAGTSTFVLAYALHKLFAPLRISITLVSVPLIVRYFRKAGLFKPPSSL